MPIRMLLAILLAISATLKADAGNLFYVGFHSNDIAPFSESRSATGCSTASSVDAGLGIHRLILGQCRETESQSYRILTWFTGITLEVRWKVKFSWPIAGSRRFNTRLSLGNAREFVIRRERSPSSNRIVFEATEAGVTTSQFATPTAEDAYHFKIRRSGNVLTGQISVDGGASFQTVFQRTFSALQIAQTLVFDGAVLDPAGGNATADLDEVRADAASTERRAVTISVRTPDGRLLSGVVVSMSGTLAGRATSEPNGDARFGDLLKDAPYKFTVVRDANYAFFPSELIIGNLEVSQTQVSLAFPLQSGNAPDIVVTETPACGSLSPLRVHTFQPIASNYRAAVYIEVPGLGWWSKPTQQVKAVDFDASGNAAIPVVTGGSDITFSRAVAYLIPKWLDPPLALGDSNTPSSLNSYSHYEVSRKCQ